MIVLIFEGYTDLVLFYNIFKKFDYKDKGINKRLIKEIIGKLIENLTVRALYKDENDIILISVGGKGNIEKLVKHIEDIEEKIKSYDEKSKIIFVVDKDSENIVKNIGQNNKLVYKNTLEDIILRILNDNEKKVLDNVYNYLKEKGLLKFEQNEKLIDKCKISILHTIYNPECFEPTISYILKNKNKDILINIYEIKEILKKLYS